MILGWRQNCMKCFKETMTSQKKMRNYSTPVTRYLLLRLSISSEILSSNFAIMPNIPVLHLNIEGPADMFMIWYKSTISLFHKFKRKTVEIRWDWDWCCFLRWKLNTKFCKVLYHSETWDLMARRWGKLEKDFLPKTGVFDISKVLVLFWQLSSIITKALDSRYLWLHQVWCWTQ